MTRATDVAGVCGEIVKRTAKYIQGRKYVQVEGWQSIAAAHGCVASATNVQRVDGGFSAIGELRRSDGTLVATAEGFVGEDEPTWFGGESVDKWGKKKTLPKRPDFAIRAMAQTRAISRVCRSAFAFVVVLIDSNLSTTPAEEMEGIYPEHEPEQARKTRTESSPAAPLTPSAVLPRQEPTAAGAGPVLELTGEMTLCDYIKTAKTMAELEAFKDDVAATDKATAEGKAARRTYNAMLRELYSGDDYEERR
ncbi:MAG TPA: hypothetical protein VF077_13220 [Nitrospiraceae bacterium]